MHYWAGNLTIATYDRIAVRYAAKSLDASPESRRPHRTWLRRFAEAVARNAPAGGLRRLDVACRPRHAGRWFRERGSRVVEVDLSAGTLAEARRLSG